MTLWLNCESKPTFSFHYRKLAEQVVTAALEAEAFPYEAEVSLTLVDDAQMRAINRETRGIDAPTDVLSFPMLEYPAPADFSELAEDLADAVNPDTGEVVLGDIVLSIDKVHAQAISYGHSERREYAFLIAHSMLHLVGYDHMEPEEREQMEARQRVILNTVHIER